MPLSYQTFVLSAIFIFQTRPSIGYDAFNACGLTSITIPEGVTSIGSGAFDTCSSLTSITIPDGVTKIEERTFRGCAGLTRTNIPDNVTNIGEYAFYACEGLTSIIIPDNVTSIGAYAYEHCTGLTDVTIPNSVTTIEHSAFNLCPNLSDVYFNGNEAEWTAIRIGRFNTPLTSATIHYRSSSSAPTPTPDPIPDTENTYTHFGKLDDYDRNGSVVIDGAKYQFAEEYKNSSSNIGPMWVGDYTDNYVYALYSLDANNKITALKCNYGVICKLEGWDAVNSIVDTDRLDIAGPGGSQLGLKSGD